ncbi:MAG: hypothetical protein IT342_02365 [Candidatus Melainabacteria bacterium]|nr:hypothetical protein [Candidatus Melainabacteria bacterium]
MRKEQGLVAIRDCMQIETYGALFSKTSIFVFAGDQSGAEHAAPIIQELKETNRKQSSELHFFKAIFAPPSAVHFNVPAKLILLSKKV